MYAIEVTVRTEQCPQIALDGGDNEVMNPCTINELARFITMVEIKECLVLHQCS